MVDPQPSLTSLCPVSDLGPGGARGAGPPARAPPLIGLDPDPVNSNWLRADLVNYDWQVPCRGSISHGAVVDSFLMMSVVLLDGFSLMFEAS